MQRALAKEQMKAEGNFKFRRQSAPPMLNPHRIYYQYER